MPKNLQINILHLRNYCCQEHMTRVHRVMVLVFGLFSVRIDTAEHAVVPEYVCIVLTKTELEHVISRGNGVSIHVNSLPVT